MAFADLVNGTFETLGGLALWQNVRRIRQDRGVQGVDWRSTLLFTTWGFYNTWYYPSLGQWWSFAGGLVIVAGNCAWLYFAYKFRRKDGAPN